jgi:HEAT repeat protein
MIKRNQSLKEAWKKVNNLNVEQLINLLGDRDPGPHLLTAIYVRLENKGESAIRSLINVLNDDDIAVRRNAVEVLGKMKNESTIMSLINVFMDEDPKVCRRALYALWLIGESSVKYLLEGLENSEWRIRKWSAVTLGEITYRRARDPPGLRFDLARIFILERRRTDVDIEDIRNKAVNTLTTLCTDENEEVRKYATWALKKLK